MGRSTAITWWGALSGIAAGMGLWAWGHVASGGLLVAVGVLALMMRTLLAAFERVSEAVPRVPREAPLVFAGVEVLFILGGALAFQLHPLDLPGALRVAAGATAAQVLLAGLGYDPVGGRRRWARKIFPAVGHGTVLLGTLGLLTPAGSPMFVGITYSAGFALLTLHGFWTQRILAGGDQALPTAAWEVSMLVVLGVTVATTAMAYVRGPPGSGPFGGDPLVAGALAIAALVLLALLGSPPKAPTPLATRSDTLSQILAHGGALLLIANLLFLILVVVARWSSRLALGLLLLVLGAAVFMEWASVIHDMRTMRARPPPTPRIEPRPVTVVVAARNEASVLAESMAQNLAHPWPLRFLLVPAANSSDDTVAIAEELAARNPHRVRALVGTSGSKAEDLNLAWGHVDTEYVIVLDADETLDEDFLPRGLAVLQENPEVGLVQGRKVSKNPHATVLARFISAERRHSTTLDHTLHSDAHGAAHFAGSGAMFRRQVPVELGGWRTDTLTEDIEFTLRLHLQNVWRIVYDPRMLVRESDPTSLRDLLRQRARWSRGWAQCCAKHLPSLLRRRRRIGTSRALALAWLLAMSVSAPLMALLPATLLLRVTGYSLLLPLGAALAITAIILPSRLAGYLYAALRDPVIPIPRTPGRLLELCLHAYFWILFGWLVQFHALYLELSSAPHRWYVTRKTRSHANPVRC